MTDAPIYVPGVFRCPKCNFRLIQSNLNAQDGTVTARDAPGDKCPNDGSPMWRVTYRDELAEAYKICEQQVARAVAAEKRASAQDELVEALAVGERFLNACNSAWAAGEPEHRVKTMLDLSDEFRSALDRAAQHRSAGE